MVEILPVHGEMSSSVLTSGVAGKLEWSLPTFISLTQKTFNLLPGEK
jgi:hypothetical protein